MPHKSDEETRKNNKSPGKSRPSASTMPDIERAAQPSSLQDSSPMDKFNAALRKILSVPKKDIK